MTERIDFLIRGIPPEILKELGRDVRRTRRSIQDVLNGILCERYGLECPPQKGSSRLRKGRLPSPQQLLWMPTDLKSAIAHDALARRMSEQRVVHKALEAHYVQEAA